MPKPSPRKLGKARDISESPDNKNKRASNDVSVLEQSKIDAKSTMKRKINKKILKEIKKHVKDELQQKHLITMIEEAMSKPMEFEEILIRNPSSWIRSLSSNFTWTNRELEWYFAEDRFLFAADNEDDCDKWVCIMNWLLARIEEEEDEHEGQGQQQHEEVFVEEIENNNYTQENQKKLKSNGISNFDNESTNIKLGESLNIKINS